LRLSHPFHAVNGGIRKNCISPKTEKGTMVFEKGKLEVRFRRSTGGSEFCNTRCNDWWELQKGFNQMCKGIANCQDTAWLHRTQSINTHPYPRLNLSTLNIFSTNPLAYKTLISCEIEQILRRCVQGIAVRALLPILIHFVR
jgi:hypothetical protein